MTGFEHQLQAEDYARQATGLVGTDPGRQYATLALAHAVLALVANRTQLRRGADRVLVASLTVAAWAATIWFVTRLWAG